MTLVAWLKAAHIIALAVWAASLFYLPALFASHASTPQGLAWRRLRALTRFTYVRVASPAAVLAIITGATLLPFASLGPWLPLKLTVVTAIIVFHVYCGSVLARLGKAPGETPARALLWLLAIPSILVPMILYLVLAKPG